MENFLNGFSNLLFEWDLDLETFREVTIVWTNLLQHDNIAKQVWYADDFAARSSLNRLKAWWDMSVVSGAEVQLCTWPYAWIVTALGIFKIYNTLFNSYIYIQTIHIREYSSECKHI